MVSDQIAGAANASSLSVGDFKMSLAAGGSVMAAAGQDFDQVATAIALMGAAGIKGSDAGTSLKSMFNNLIPSTKGARKAMEEVGLWTEDAGSAFVNMDGSIKDVSEISGLLTDTLGHLTEAQRLTALETIFGTDGMRAALVMTNAGAEGYDNMADQHGQGHGRQCRRREAEQLQGGHPAVAGLGRDGRHHARHGLPAAAEASGRRRHRRRQQDDPLPRGGRAASWSRWSARASTS